MKTNKSIKQIMIAMMVILASSTSYGQFYNSGGYQGGGHGSGGDETLGKCQELMILEGWSGISTWVSPYEKDAENIFDPLGNTLTILYNFNGVYWPSTSTNTLGPWDAYSGYITKLSDDAMLRMCGDELTDKTVSLNATWDLIPVLSATTVSAESLFEGLVGFGLAKAIGGAGVYWPLYNINTLIALEPGKAYYVYTTSPGTINFSAKCAFINCEKPAEFATLSPWNDVHQTPATHIVALTKQAAQIFQPGDIIGAFTTNGLCAAMVVYSGKESALSLNGDDVLTEVSDGFKPNESISYQLYRPSTNESFALKVGYEPMLDNSGLFNINSMSAIIWVSLTGLSAFSDMEESGFRIFPNPSHGIFNLEGIEGDIELTIHNTYGESILQSETSLPTQIDLSAQVNGIYFIRISSEKGNYFKKLVLD